MDTRKIVSSGSVGRRPADNPLAVLISYRVDQETAEALDRELAARKSPGLTLSKNDIARMLMAERLQELHAPVQTKPKK